MKAKSFISGLLIGSITTLSISVFSEDIFKITNNSYPIYVDGNKKDINGLNVNGSTYLGLQPTADALNASVKFNSDNKTIEIYSNENKHIKTNNNTSLPNNSIPEVTYNDDNSTITKLKDEVDDFTITTYKKFKAIKYKEYTYVLLSQLNLVKRLTDKNGLKIYKYNNNQTLELILEIEDANYENYVIHGSGFYININLVKDYLI